MAAKKAIKSKKSTVVAKQKDGTVQITFSIDWKDIEARREETIKELAKNVDIAGFRRGKAPLAKAREKLDPQFVIERTLSQILPKLFAEAVKAEKIKPAMYPKFELVHAHEGEDWQVRATTAQIPEFKLGDYKKMLKGAATEIWTPDKGDPNDLSAAGKKEPTREEKENSVIKALQENYKFGIPKILIDEEVNSRLASLLERIEKLGLSLESYLSSVNKDVEKLREEYGQQAEVAIRLDIVLGAIAQAEKVTVTDEDISQFVNAANASSPENKMSEDQKSSISSFLIKRKVIDKLASIV